MILANGCNITKSEKLEFFRTHCIYIYIYIYIYIKGGKVQRCHGSGVMVRYVRLVTVYI